MSQLTGTVLYDFNRSVSATIMRAKHKGASFGAIAGALRCLAAEWEAGKDQQFVIYLSSAEFAAIEREAGAIMMLPSQYARHVLGLDGKDI